MGAAEDLNLSGKDWLTVEEAAHYCGVCIRQFREHALAYGLQPRNFMGKKLYEKAALYQAIYESEQWHPSPSTGAKASPISTGGKARSATASASGESPSERLRRYERRKKRS